jgi:hypothetical protein
VAFLSSTPLYRSENRWIIGNHGKTGARKFYTYHVGQYLPDWHPWEKYDEFFVGSPRTNAIREILCIELPWLTECFGKVADFSCSWSRTSSLNLPYPDTCQVLLRHADGTAGNLTVDCVSRKAVRNLRISGEEGTILWEGNSQSLRYLPPSGEPVHPLLEEKELERQAICGFHQRKPIPGGTAPFFPPGQRRNGRTGLRLHPPPGDPGVGRPVREGVERAMKACFFGMGSIGMRHARNLRHLLGTRGQKGEIHALRSGRGGEMPKAWRTETVPPERPDLPMTWSSHQPPMMHYETLPRPILGKPFSSRIQFFIVL